MLNRPLYEKLKAAFQTVLIEQENVKPHIELLRTPKQIGDRLITWQFVDYGESYRINCPICGDSNGYHCYISAMSYVRPSVDGQLLSRAGLIAHCFRRDCFSNNPEAKLLLGNLIRSADISDSALIVETEESLFESDSTEDIRDLDDLKQWQPDYHPVDETTPIEVLSYIAKRGISAIDIQEMHIGWGKCWNYKKQDFINDENWLMFPIQDQTGIRGFQSRQLRDSKMKYFFDPRTPKKMCLYNRERACHYPIVTISEGVVDALHVGPCGMAYFGVEPSKAQKKLIQQDGAKMVLYLPDQKRHYTDGKCDLDPVQIADNIIEQWKAEYDFEWGIHRVNVPAPDPGDCPREEIWKAVIQQVKTNEIIKDVLVEHAERMINYG